MSKQTEFIGATLVFTRKEQRAYKAIQASYIFEHKNLLDFVNNINTLSETLLESEFNGYDYMGVSDMFITDEEGEFNFLGRTSFFDDKTYKDAKKHILDKNDVISSLKKIGPNQKVNIGLVFFHQDKEGSEYNSTIIIYSQVSSNRSYEHIIEEVNKPLFKQEIVNFSIEQLYIDNLEFIGVSDIYKVKGVGLFQQQGSFETIEEINSQLYTKKEFNERFEEIKEDCKFIG